MTNKAKIYVASAVSAVASLFGLSSFAAADPTVLEVAGNVATTTQENMIGIIHQNIPIIIVVGVLILGVTLTWKLLRRFTGR